MIKILSESNQHLGMAGYVEYLVEADPQYAKIFFRAYTIHDKDLVVMDLPLPRSLYVVNAPEFDAGGKPKKDRYRGAVAKMFALEDNGKPVEDDTPIYLLPWPNYYLDGSFAVCYSEYMHVPEGATKEQVVENTIIENWGINFGYMAASNSATAWLAQAPDNRAPDNWTERYAKWEKLSLEEAAKLPWGKPVPSGLNWLGTAETTTTVGELKGAHKFK